MGIGCLPLVVFLILLALLPIMFGHVMAGALLKLHLDPAAAILLAIGILLGGALNLPVRRFIRTEEMLADPFAILGLPGLWPRVQRVQRETILAVNVGGCVIPTGLALYEAGHVVAAGAGPAVGLGLAVLVNTVVCYWVARPMKGIGIAMPGLVPPIVAVLAALVLVPDERVPVAFVAGVLGPLLGADVMHLRDIPHISTGVASIGGAGTFDGIVLSGIVAAYLA